MKRIYENFAEIARDFTDGTSVTHTGSEHKDPECIGWQHGVKEFAEFLDGVGLSLVANPEIHEVLWEKALDKIHKKETKKLIEHVCPNPTCKHKSNVFLKSLIEIKVSDVEIKRADIDNGIVVVRTCPKCGTFFGPIQ